MSSATARGSVTARGCVTVRAYPTTQLQQHFPQWGSYSPAVKNRLVRTVTPTHEQTTRNTTTATFNEYVVDNLDKDQSTNENATHLAIGDDAASGIDSGNTSLNNEQGRFLVTNSIDKGNNLFLSTFLDQNQGNPINITEIGIFTASSGGLMLNHAQINELRKRDSTTATIDVTFELRVG